ncbi:MAG: hypothetical protein FH748_07835 [Balneolaceae bacterium]|nr:hypothetical protein [Balneolaceae bacterium]
MIWNVAGWLGMGLLDMHAHSHEKGEHCEVSFCYCEIENGNKICTCHHPELHAQQNQAPNHPETEPDTSESVHQFCHYTPSHPNPEQSEALISFTSFNTILPPAQVEYMVFTTSEYHNDMDSSLLTGHFIDLLRPPRR